MQSTNPKNILTNLHLIRAGLASGLLTKEEVVDWADKIIIKDEKPDIFFIDLAMSSSKSKNDIIHYFNDYLNFESPLAPGRPLLGLLYSQYKNRQFNLKQTICKLYSLKFEAIFTEREEGHIYSIDGEYELAENKIYGTIENVQIQLENFLILYKDYSLDNFSQWHDLDKQVDFKLQQEYEIEKEKLNKNNQPIIKESKKPWWKFW